MSTRSKHGRMQIRIDGFSKHKIERAAHYARQSVSEFVVSNAAAAADKVIEKHDESTLSNPDWEVFYEAILNPPTPNKTLRTAFKRHQSGQQGRTTSHS
jgi:uncharacterized protein (DUF1778 family)